MEGRILTESEEVDHIDGDKTNDDIDNLQILTKSENRKKHAKENPKTLIEVQCRFCGVMFKREKRGLHGKRLTEDGRMIIFCDRSCSCKAVHYGLKN